jgi:hypothetical protein
MYAYLWAIISVDIVLQICFKFYMDYQWRRVNYSDMLAKSRSRGGGGRSWNCWQLSIYTAEDNYANLGQKLMTLRTKWARICKLILKIVSDYSVCLLLLTTSSI